MSSVFVVAFLSLRCAVSIPFFLMCISKFLDVPLDVSGYSWMFLVVPQVSLVSSFMGVHFSSIFFCVNGYSFALHAADIDMGASRALAFPFLGGLSLAGPAYCLIADNCEDHKRSEQLQPIFLVSLSPSR